MTNEKLLTAGELLVELKISRATLWRLCKSGHITPIRLGTKSLRFDLSAVMRELRGAS
jgi:predicted DNA-binding transcriptional regulator AlpA